MPSNARAPPGSWPRPEPRTSQTRVTINSKLRERNYITVTKSSRLPLQSVRARADVRNRQVVSSVTEPFERFATNRWGPDTAMASGSSNMYSGDESTLTTVPVEALNSVTELPS